MRSARAFERPRWAGAAVLASIVLAINALFILKYADGVTRIPSPVYAFGYVVAGAAGLALYAWLMGRWQPSTRVAAIALGGLLLGFVVVAIALLLRIDRYGLQVDRWSAIQDWLDFLFQGRYPYDALTHRANHASPFPTWQLLHIPFYMAGDVGYAQVFALPAFALATVAVTRNVRAALLFVVLMLASPAFWYEVAVRSDLMTNMLVSMLFVVWVGSRPGFVRRSPYVVGIVAGLLLSTRLLVVVPIIVALGVDAWRLRSEPLRLATAFALMVGTFVLTFVPFVLWDIGGGAFLRNDPFVLQTNKLDGWVVALGIVVAGWLSLRSPTLVAKLTAIAITVSGMMLVLLVQNLLAHGWDAVRADIVDVAYVATALPFAALGYALRPILRMPTLEVAESGDRSASGDLPDIAAR